MVEKINKLNTTLIIVESPTKIKTISKYLGKNFVIQSSKGHLIDLPKSRMGIDIENHFEPHYATIRGKGPILAILKKAAKNSQQILLATDPDREGEAISWHLENALKLINTNIKRIEFNEITKEAVLNAIANPRDIDIALVNSQQARRLLDRLVGYSISPVLQDKFGSKRFSAGRVQSVALRILCDRENEINNFKSIEYWEIETTWTNNTNKKDNKSIFKLVQINNKTVNISNKEQVEQVEKDIHNFNFNVSLCQISERITKPSPPYTTSKLQQEASTRLNFRVRKTMMIAQSLYEGIDVKGNTIGLITYMRTDSTRISPTGLAMARDYIKNNFPQYLPSKANIYHSAKQAQDAHEAIRPTNVNYTPNSIKSYLTSDEYKLYNIIWEKFIASQMKPSIDEIITTEISSTKEHHINYLFRHTASKLIFKGFKEIWNNIANHVQVPSFLLNEKVTLSTLKKYQKFTQPPYRYTEASLIKIMEESGIGRPATYVPTINTLDKRSYISRKGRQLVPTTLGNVINTMLVEYFPNIVDITFTANLEKKLDSISNNTIEWKSMLADFFIPFKKTIDYAMLTMESKTELTKIPLHQNCPTCTEGQLFKKLGKNGYFIGCDQFKNGCRHSESIPVGICPLCNSNVVAKKGKKRGKKFYGCSAYNTTGCTFTMLEKVASKTCPQCNSIMGEKSKKSGTTLTCQNQKCNFILEEKVKEE